MVFSGGVGGVPLRGGARVLEFHQPFADVAECGFYPFQAFLRFGLKLVGVGGKLGGVVLSINQPLGGFGGFYRVASLVFSTLSICHS